MIGSSRAVGVCAYPAPADLRRAYNGLFGMVKNGLARDPLSGDCYLFVNRRRKSCKVLLYDGTGLCIFMKRLGQKRSAELWREGGQFWWRLTRRRWAPFWAYRGRLDDRVKHVKRESGVVVIPLARRERPATSHGRVNRYHRAGLERCSRPGRKVRFEGHPMDGRVLRGVWTHETPALLARGRAGRRDSRREHPAAKAGRDALATDRRAPGVALAPFETRAWG